MAASQFWEVVTILWISALSLLGVVKLGQIFADWTNGKFPRKKILHSDILDLRSTIREIRWRNELTFRDLESVIRYRRNEPTELQVGVVKFNHSQDVLIERLLGKVDRLLEQV